MRHLGRAGRRRLLARPGPPGRADGALPDSLAGRPGARRRRRPDGDRGLRPVPPRGARSARPGARRRSGGSGTAWRSRYFLGATVDLDETYAWGFAELARIEADMRAVADKIVPGGTVDDAVNALKADPARTHPRARRRSATGCRAWPTGPIAELHGTHFDIPEQVRRIECCLAPDLGRRHLLHRPERGLQPARSHVVGRARRGSTRSRPGRRSRPSTTRACRATICRSRQTAVRAELLNRWQRLLCWCSGHGEGWALYAERLMDELGYLDDPGDRLGMLDAQAMRAARVVVDIGMHLELEIPADNRLGRPQRHSRVPPGRAVDARAGLGVHAGALQHGRTRTSGSSSTGTWAGRDRRRRTRSASGSGCRPAPTPRRARGPTSTSRRSTGPRSTSARSASTRCARRSTRICSLTTDHECARRCRRWRAENSRRRLGCASGATRSTRRMGSATDARAGTFGDRAPLRRRPRGH